MNKIVVVSALWCPSCLLLKKHLKKLKEEYSNLEIETLDYDFDEDIVSRYNVGDKLPVIISKKDEQEVNRLIGEKDYNDIVNFLKGDDII